MTQESLSKAIAIVSKWIVLISFPKYSKSSHYIIDFILVIIGDTNWQPLFKSEPSTIARLDHNNAWAVEVMTAIREFIFEELYWGMIEAETKEL